MDPLALPAFATAQPALTTLVIVAIGGAASVLVDWLVRTLDAGRYGWQRRVRQRLGVAEGQHIGELRWLLVSSLLLLWPFLAFLLLHVWGLHDLGDAVSEMLTGGGVKIGSVGIVPSHLLMGVLWFVLLVTLTRYLKKKLEREWLPLARMDAGVRVSVATLFGYLTFILAMMVGLSVAGLDLSKLAIVAGALSVGIGFGLQNVFNNFVSGLILLFERPVRVGDYVRVGSTEGFVRDIRIRATLLETWDKTAIIVPNSELISNRVENFTFGNTWGRVLLPVTVEIENDPLKVAEVLRQVLKQHPKLVQEGEVPGIGAPFVSFKDFAAGQLTFEIGGHVRNIHERGGVASELRYAILAAFAAEGIKMPPARQPLELVTPLPAPFETSAAE